MSDTPKRAAFAWVAKEFDPRGYTDSLLTALAEVDAARVRERETYRLEQEAVLELAEVEADASAPFLVSKDLGDAKAREKAAKAGVGKDEAVLRAREKAREAVATHDSCEAAFEHAERRFKALVVLGGLNTGILKFLAGVP